MKEGGQKTRAVPGQFPLGARGEQKRKPKTQGEDGHQLPFILAPLRMAQFTGGLRTGPSVERIPLADLCTASTIRRGRNTHLWVNLARG